MVLRFTFTILGLAALTIGALIFAFGPAVTGQIFATMLRAVMPAAPPVVALGGADVDSEMRFYAVLWMGYGGGALWVSQRLPQRISLLRLMVVIFLLGGVGRAISYVAVGAPHPLFSVLMWIELALPIVLLALSYRRVETPSA